MSDAQRREAPPQQADSRPTKELARVGDLFTNADFIRRLSHAVSTHTTPNRMLATLGASIRKNPLLLQCSVVDIAGKAIFLAAAGLEPDTALQLAHLIPFKEKRWNRVTKRQEETIVCQVVIGYRGLVDLSWRSGKLRSINAQVVWPDEVRAGAFAYEFGTSRHLRHQKLGNNHKISPEAQAAGDAEYPMWAYCDAETDGGGHPFEVLSWTDIQLIRNGSPAFRSAQWALNEAKQKDGARLPNGWVKAPWVAFLPQMMQKTAVRALSDFLPRSIELANVLAVDTGGDRKTLDMGAIIDLKPEANADEAMGMAADISGEGNDPGATFGMRGDDEDAGNQGEQQQTQTTAAPTRPPAAQGRAPAAPRQPAARQQTQAAAPAQAPAAAPAQRQLQRQAPAQAVRPAFVEAYLCNAAGDMVDGPFGDAATWAKAFWREHGSAFPFDVPALFEMNADTIEAIRRDFPAIELPSAAEHEGGVGAGEQELPGEQQEGQPPDPGTQTTISTVPIALAKDRGRADWDGYIEQVRQALEVLDWTDDMEAVLAVNLPVLSTAPIAAQLVVRRFVVAHCQNRNVEVPASTARLADAPAPAQRAPAAPTPAPAQQPPPEPAPSPLAAQEWPADWAVDVGHVKQRIEEVAAFGQYPGALKYYEGPAIKLLRNRLRAAGKEALADHLDTAIKQVLASKPGAPPA